MPKKVLPLGGGAAPKAAESPPVSELESPKLKMAGNWQSPPAAAAARSASASTSGSSSAALAAAVVFTAISPGRQAVVVSRGKAGGGARTMTRARVRRVCGAAVGVGLRASRRRDGLIEIWGRQEVPWLKSLGSTR
jgi:hypothetical protein